MFASANDARTTLSCRKTKKKQNVKMWFSFRTKNSTVSSLHALVFLRGHTPSRNSPSSEATVSARSVTSSKPMTLEILCIRIWFLWQLSTRFTVLAYRYLHPQTCIYSWSVPTQDGYTPYLAEEFRQSSSDEARQRLRSASSSSLVVRRTRLSTIGDRAFPKCRCCPTVEHSAAERHVGVVTDCFRETFEDTSLQSFFPRISSSACAVTLSFRTL